MKYQYSDRDGIMLNATEAVRIDDSVLIHHCDGQYYIVADKSTAKNKYDWTKEDIKATCISQCKIRSIQMHVESQLNDIIIAYYYTTGAAIAISMDDKIIVPITLIDDNV